MLEPPFSLNRDISPPTVSKRRKFPEADVADPAEGNEDSSKRLRPSLAAIEAGRARIQDHLDYFAEHLKKAVRPPQEDVPQLSMSEFADLYQSNQHAHGNHFVVHQHNHPVAGVHYDLRLQFSQSSSISFAIPYGLPGNPNSRRQGRMAIETRVHNLWNHLIESASNKTGSLLIWDTGIYTILPRHKQSSSRQRTPDLSDTDSDPDLSTRPVQPGGRNYIPENEKLIEAFQSRYVRLRLHGSRLPKRYTVTLRLPTANIILNPNHSVSSPHKRRRKRRSAPAPASTDSEPDKDAENVEATPMALAAASEDEVEDDAAEIRRSNAYTGASNTIGSVHQRRWFLSLDKHNSGFVKSPERGQWVRNGDAGFETFYVLGAQHERSVVTGRAAAEVERDEGVEGFVGRKGWRAVME